MDSFLGTTERPGNIPGAVLISVPQALLCYWVCGDEQEKSLALHRGIMAQKNILILFMLFQSAEKDGKLLIHIRRIE